MKLNSSKMSYQMHLSVFNGANYIIKMSCCLLRIAALLFLIYANLSLNHLMVSICA